MDREVYGVLDKRVIRRALGGFREEKKVIRRGLGIFREEKKGIRRGLGIFREDKKVIRNRYATNTRSTNYKIRRQ